MSTKLLTFFVLCLSSLPSFSGSDMSGPDIDSRLDDAYQIEADKKQEYVKTALRSIASIEPALEPLIIHKVSCKPIILIID